MEIKPKPFRRGDTLDTFEGHLIGGIGAFSQACVSGNVLKQPLEVLLAEGSRESGFRTRVGDAAHKVYEGVLSQAAVSFTLEAFQTNRGGNILENLRRDSGCLRISTKGELRTLILEMSEQENIKGALLYIKALASGIHTYGHTNAQKINNATKTFDHVRSSVAIEGWGNLSFIHGKLPFAHIHGTYESQGVKKGGHFIMDEKTSLDIEAGELIIFPTSAITRAPQDEDFPTWET